MAAAVTGEVAVVSVPALAAGRRRGVAVPTAATALSRPVQAAAGLPPARSARVEGRRCSRRAGVRAAAAAAAEAAPDIREADAPSASLSKATLLCSKDEAYRFTDVSGLLSERMLPTPAAADTLACSSSIDFSRFSLPAADTTRLVVVDGVFVREQSNVTGVPAGVSVASAATEPNELSRNILGPYLGSLSSSIDADPFTVVNTATARDVTMVHVPAGVRVEQPIHVVYYSTSAADGVQLCSPRLLVVVEEEAEVTIIEEFAGEGPSATSAVAEFVLAKKSRVVHGYVQQQSSAAYHIKATYVSQAEGSAYEMTEAGLGGKLSRHNLRMDQQGPETQTQLHSFLLASHGQLHDLHTSVKLDHPRGQVRQLHKCIVTDSTGRGVFDGNVKVNRYAQQTDAGQLSRNLLLAPRATVNVKPNLQIIADDVKCTHGAAISDLDDEEVFYFLSRGIDAETARSALVFSFGAEVVEKLPTAALRKRVESVVLQQLKQDTAFQRSNV
eukprot:jgi/Chlat1/9204/Chrsp97S00714